MIDYLSLAGVVSRARLAARAFLRASSIPIVIGCAPPSTCREIRAVSTSVATASRTSSSVAPGSDEHAIF